MFEISNGLLTRFKPEPNETSVKIPDEVKEVASDAFSIGSNYLKEITLSDNMLKASFIQLSAKFPALEKIKITKNIVDIVLPIDVNYCDHIHKNMLLNLVNIEVDEENETFSSEDGLLYNKDKTILIKCPCAKENVKICDTVTLIKNFAFLKNQKLKNIEIPNSVIEIEKDAFKECSSLEYIKLSDNLNSLGERAFWECENLKKIEIPSTVKVLDYATFRDCKELEEVKLSENLETISSSAFLRTKLKSIIIPDSVTSIGDNAFSTCTELETVKFSKNLNKIEDRAFAGCQKLKDIEIPESVTLLGRNVFEACVSLKNIEIPKNVTNLGYEVFYNCINLESVKLHDDIDNMGLGIFANCKSLKEIKIPSKMTYIPPSFIENCTSIKEIQFPENIKEIQRHAFLGCEGLKTIHITKNIKNIEFKTFAACYNLESFTVDEDNPNYSVEDGVLYNKDKSILYCIPRAKSGIFKMAENTKNIKSFDICGESIFENCKKLSKVIFNENFKDKAITFQDFGAPDRRRSASERYSDNVYEVLNNMAASFYPSQLSSEMKKEIIGGVLKAINNKDLIDDKWKKDWLKYLKSQRKNLYSKFVENVDGLRVLLDEKIFNLDDFKSLLEIASEKSYVNVSSLLLEYQNRTFSADEVIDSTTKDLCVDVNSVSYLKENWTFKKNDDGTMTIVNYKGNDIDIDVPEFVGKNKVVAIGEYAFSPRGKRISDEQKAFRHTITSINLPDTIKDVSPNAFWDCDGLTTLNLSKGMTELSCGIETIKESGGWERNYSRSILYGCKNIEEIVIPEGITVLNSEVFVYMPNLKKVTLPSTLLEIGKEAFANCINLIEVNLPSSLKIIRGNAFYKCNNLKNTEFPSSLEQIDYNAFDGCISLTEANLPSSIKSIGSSAFANCSGLEKVNLPSSINSLENNCFARCESLKSINIPGSLSIIDEDAFYGCTNLKTLIIQDGVTDIGECAFYNCTNLVDVTLPSTLKNISSSAFACCSNLKSIDFHSSLEILGKKSFSECKSLTNITIPESVKAIDSSAFSKSGLESINILEGITEIGKEAFSECNLENVTLPHSVKIIYDFAFRNCKKLKTINIFENLEKLNSNAFYGCELLENINVDEKNANFSTIDGVLYNKDQTQIIRIPAQKKNIELPKSITILNSLSGANNIESIVIGENITEIVNYAFGDCKNLNKIVFENHSIKILPDAYIPIVALQNGINSIYPKQLHFEIRPKCYDAACTLLLDNNSSVTEEWRKEWSKYLKSNKKSLYDDMLIIPKLLEFMIKEALLNAVDITELKKDASEQVLVLLNEYEKANISEADKKSAKAKIEKKEDVNSMAYIKKNWNFKEEEDGTIQIINYKGSDLNLVVPAVINEKPVTTIGYGAFSPLGKRIAKGQDEIRKAIKSIVIPDGVKVIEEKAFFECESLESLTLPDSIVNIATSEDEGWYENPMEHKYGILFGCKSLKSITIPKGIEKIPTYFLCNCKYIENIDLPVGLKYIDMYSFYNCASLKKIIIPESVTEIYFEAFASCINLESITLPDVPIKIAYNCFFRCKSLNNIVIPKNIDFNNISFQNCERLTNIKILSDNVIIHNKTFSQCISLKNFEFTKNMGDTIVNNMFDGCSSLENFVVPNFVTKIEDYAFFNCTSLNEITIGSNVTTLGRNIFYKCDNVIIHCEKDSAAEEYAKKNNINYDNNL